MSELEELRAAYEACLPYARRYDWLRKRTVVYTDDSGRESLPMWADILDTHIDAALSREGT